MKLRIDFASEDEAEIVDALMDIAQRVYNKDYKESNAVLGDESQRIGTWEVTE